MATSVEFARRKERAAFSDYEKRRKEYLHALDAHLSKPEVKAKRARFIRARTLWRTRRRWWYVERALALKKYVRFDQAKVTRELAEQVLQPARSSGVWKGSINGPRGGARTFAMQAALYALYLSGAGAPAFPPNGPSRHLRANIARLGPLSNAVDVSDPEGLLRWAQSHHPMNRPHNPPEPWHCEVVL